MAELITAPNFRNADEAYAMIVAAHAGLSDHQSMEFNARLILILANHIGDTEVLAQALELAAAAGR